MTLQTFGNNSNSAIYTKAQDILHLSRHISNYLSEDLVHLQTNGRENSHIYFTGDLIQQSVSLGPQILKAESPLFQDEKSKHIDSVMRLSNLLYKNCRRLEKINSNGKDFLPLLRKELKKFQKLQHVWQLTL